MRYSSYLGPKRSLSASSSGIICKKLIVNINNGIIIILITFPRYTEEPKIIKKYPKYIGLREYL
jgi:hypothetical protein